MQNSEPQQLSSGEYWSKLCSDECVWISVNLHSVCCVSKSGSEEGVVSVGLRLFDGTVKVSESDHRRHVINEEEDEESGDESKVKCLWIYIYSNYLLLYFGSHDSLFPFCAAVG